MQVDLNRFRETFFQESAEHLAEMEAGLLRLDQGSFDPELLNAIFRAAHSIKGASGMFGFEDVSRFTHALENLLDQLRSGGISVTGKLTDLLLRSTDVLRELLAAASGGGAAPERMPGMLDELHVMQRAADPAGSEPPQTRQFDRPLEPAAAARYIVHFRPARDIFTQAMDPLLILRDLAGLGESQPVEIDLTALPALAALDPELCYLGWRVRLARPIRWRRSGTFSPLWRTAPGFTWRLWRKRRKQDR
jgi:two-component system chemotaxis sensor kinase CheA